MGSWLLLVFGNHTKMIVQSRLLGDMTGVLCFKWWHCVEGLHALTILEGRIVLAEVLELSATDRRDRNGARPEEPV